MSASEQWLKARQQEQEDTRLRLFDQMNPDPERGIRVFNASTATGLPYEVADADLDNVENLVSRREFDPGEYRRDSEVFSEFAAENPYHAAVIKEDLEGLGDVARAMRQIGYGFDNTWAQVKYGRIGARRQTGDHREGDEEELAELQKYMVSHEYGAQGFAGFLVKNAKMVGPTAYSFGQGLKMAGPGMVAGAAIGFGVGGLPGAAAGVARGGVAGLTTGLASGSYELERGFAYNEYIEMGLDHQTASLAAAGVGVVNAALETVSGRMTLGMIPGLSGLHGNVAKRLTSSLLARPTMGSATASVIGRFGLSLGTEVVTEGLQETVTAVTGEIVREEGMGEPLTWDRLVDRVASTMIETLQGAAILSSFGPAMSYAADSKRAYDASNMVPVYQSLIDGVQGAKIREAAPAQWKMLLERLARDGPVQNILIDGKRFREYFQENGVDPDELLAQLGVEYDSEFDSYIEVPIEVYADQIGPTKYAEELLPDIKANEDQMTAREAALFYANEPELVAEMRAAMEVPKDYQPDSAIYNTIVNDLVAAGTEQSAAETQAMQLSHGFETLAERNPNIGMTALQLFRSRWGGIRLGLPEAEGNDVNMMLDPILDRMRAGEVVSQRDIYGESMTDVLKQQGGIQDQGGELAARDVSLSIRGLVKADGMTLDEAAGVAWEAGFIQSHDEQLFMEALDRELAGEPVFTHGHNEEQARISDYMDHIDQFLSEQKIDLETTSNKEIIDRLAAGQTYNQETVDGILEEAIMAVTNDNMEQAIKLFPKVGENQNFEGVKITDKVSIKGAPASLDRDAQTVIDRSVKRRENISRLLECVSG